MPFEPYKLTEKDLKKLQRDFTYHLPKEGQQELFDEIREIVEGTAAWALLRLPDSRERSLALTKLEEFRMWANESVARKEG